MRQGKEIEWIGRLHIGPSLDHAATKWKLSELVSGCKQTVSDVRPSKRKHKMHQIQCKFQTTVSYIDRIYRYIPTSRCLCMLTAKLQTATTLLKRWQWAWQSCSLRSIVIAWPKSVKDQQSRADFVKLAVVLQYTSNSLSLSHWDPYSISQQFIKRKELTVIITDLIQR